MKYCIGLMSGTSQDGIDAALINPNNHQLLHGITCPYPQFIQNFLSDYDPSKPTLIQHLYEWHHLIGKAFADAASQLMSEAKMTPKDIEAIGNHGQTILHKPYGEIPMTIQLGCPHTLAVQTKCTVVSDFRNKDLILGGQGAPFAPLYHQILFQNESNPTIVVNIGGISNMTYLNGNHLLGYDTGPGNVLLDLWVQSNLGKPYDKNGIWSLSGVSQPQLLDTLLSDPYFLKPYPKSLDKLYFSKDWLDKMLASFKINHSIDISPQDIQATLVQFTALSIANEIQHLNQHDDCDSSTVYRVYICGGGVHNQALLNALSKALPHCKVQSTQSMGICPDYIEAMLFAWLAHQRIHQNKIDLTTITGSSEPAIIGGIFC